MLALDPWKKIEKTDVGRRFLEAMYHGCTYILICFYIFVLADVFLTVDVSQGYFLANVC